MKNILVIGSINMDLVINTPYLPNLGETINGFGFATIPGGKGANQALSAAKLGGQVKMIGCVGNDANGTELIKNLKENNVDTIGIITINTTSGIAVITVCNGDNHIILDKGANEKLTPEIIDQNIELIKWADIVLFQLEIPQETIFYAAKLAKANNAKVLLNPAPMQKINPDIIKYVDIFIPNQHEAGQMLDKEISSIDDAKNAVLQLHSQGIKQVIITLGSKGCVYNQGELIKHHDIYKVEVIDTTAAGDSFIGGLCVALCNDNNIQQAISYATAVSALTVTKKGASSSLPTKNEVDSFLDVYK